MTPKIIHYCWFGGNKLPHLALKCIASWKKYLPDYEIKEWNETNFDVAAISYTQEAYKAKKYAFVSDYARFWILYNYGGIYFDVDVEVIKPLDNILAKGAFLGCEKGMAINPGLGMGCEKGLNIYRQLLNKYSELYFLNNDGTLNLKTIVAYTTELFIVNGLKQINSIQLVSEVWIYPSEYFCPLDFHTGKLTLSCNTYTIHHYNASWYSFSQRFKLILKRSFGNDLLLKLSKLKKELK